jgi:hypothetical protein
LDLQIKYRLWNSNVKEDALLRYPISLLSQVTYVNQTDAAVAAISVNGGEEWEALLGERQRQDAEVHDIILYLETGRLPEEDKRARELVVSCDLFVIEVSVLYRVQPATTLSIIPPSGDRQKLFHVVHGGLFGGHLRATKTHSALCRHCWWPGIRADVNNWCRDCLCYATRNPGKPVRPPLTPSIALLIESWLTCCSCQQHAVAASMQWSLQQNGQKSTQLMIKQHRL